MTSSLSLLEDGLCRRPQRVRVAEIAVQDHQFVDQLLGRRALGMRLVEVADVGLGVARMVAESSSRLNLWERAWDRRCRMSMDGLLRLGAVAQQMGEQVSTLTRTATWRNTMR